MFCTFVKNLKKFRWLPEPVSAMPVRKVSDDAIAASNDECSYFDNDIPNAAHIETEHGVSHIERIKAFQFMTIYSAVVEDILRNMWKGIPEAFYTVNAE